MCGFSLRVVKKKEKEEENFVLSMRKDVNIALINHNQWV